MSHNGFDLVSAARQEMIREGFEPDFPAGVSRQLAALDHAPVPAFAAGIRDLRELLWSSIDNDTSRDLDQIEFAEKVPEGVRVLIGIADVDADVAIASPIDEHAASQTTTVYTGVATFPMLPERLSTGLTSLNEDADRLAMVVEFLVAGDGAVSSGSIYRALVRNRAQLTYSGAGAWLEAKAGPPPKVAGSPGLQAQLRLQDQAAQALREQRHRLGGLNFDRVETEALVTGGKVQEIRVHEKNRATDLIEDFMVAANEVMARTLRDAGVSSIRRVVKDPERWPRIVELAARYGEALPPQPDSAALDAFLRKQKTADPVHYSDLSLAIIKLMGPGQYVLSRPGDPAQGHFALAAHDYTHSTAPNRRFGDLVTQRLIKAVLNARPAPYSDDDLAAAAANCTQKENAARKVERAMNKRIAAAALVDRLGERFSAVVTGVTPKGVFVRVLNPPVEGLLVRGQNGLDVGDQLPVRLVSADVERGYIDFAA